MFYCILSIGQNKRIIIIITEEGRWRSHQCFWNKRNEANPTVSCSLGQRGKL